MSDKRAAQDDFVELRRTAEKNLSRMIHNKVPSLAPESVEALVHELQVHQIELQVQCEDLRRTRQEAEESRDRYRDLYESAPVGYCTLNEQGEIVEANAAVKKLLGNRIVGKRFESFIREEDDEDKIIRYVRDMFTSQERHACEMALDVGGRKRSVLLEGSVVPGREDEKQLRLAVIDITDRKEAEDRLREQDLELRESRVVLQDLNARLLSIEEDLRQSVSRDLQDEYSQRMTALMWELSALEQRHGLDLQAAYKVQEVKRQLSRMAIDLHHLSHRLHSRFLEHGELHEAMKEYIDELNVYGRPKVEFEAAKTPAGCRLDQAIALFRILQEALNNAANHARAKSVAVTLKPAGNDLVLTIRDNGKGFDSEFRTTTPAGFGLIIMRERMRAVGGRFTAESQPGRGTIITATMPRQEKR